MAYKRVLSLIVQATIGLWDEDGNLVGREVEQPFEVFFPFSQNLDRELLKRESDLLRQAREGLKR